MQSEQDNLNQSPLGQKINYVDTYSPKLLYPIPRQLARDKIGINSSLPFFGVDLWCGFELSWLNPKGKPEIALADFSFPCTSPSVVESKSFKLYLNSFNASRFDSIEEVEQTIKKDLSNSAGSSVEVGLYSLDTLKTRTLEDFSGICLDTLDIETSTYQVDVNLLKVNSSFVEESVYSNLLKSNCLATGQPDWGSVFIKYKGSKIDHESLLKYIISFRKHAGFAEHCVEHIFSDILSHCKPSGLTVYARYTRRGGLDINPFRSNFEQPYLNIRQFRQ